MFSSKDTIKDTDEHADHSAQKAQGGGCCGGHEHGPGDKEQRDEPCHDKPVADGDHTHA